MSAGENERPGERDRPGRTEQPDGVGRLLAGRYRVVAPLGRGGMGVVWRARDEVLGREVAVKELRTFTDANAPELAGLGLRMQREARAAARVRHPGVVAVHDVAEIDGRPLIVMELVDGPSLDDVLRERGTLDAREAAGIGAKVMDALAAAHRAGVLHRDVKPGNILLDRSGRVVLTDFGIATMEDPGDGSTTHLTRSGELVGSLDYLAPERAQGHQPGPASDIWALGATLYAAVEGSSPFRRTSTWSTLTAIVAEELPEPRRAGPLGPVLRQLMHKRPESRPEAGRARLLLEAVAEGADLADQDSATRGLRAPARPARDTTERAVPVVPPGFGPPPQQGAGGAAGSGAWPGSHEASRPGPGHPGSGTPHGSASATAAAGTPAPSTTPGAPAGSFDPSGAGGPSGPGSPPGSMGFGPAQPVPGAPASGTPGEPAPGASATSRRRRTRVLLAAAALTVVLVTTGVTLAVLENSDDSARAAGPGSSRGADTAASPGATRGSVDLTDDTRPREQGDKGKSPSPTGKPDATGDAEQTDEAPAPSPEATGGGTPEGGSDGGTTGGGDASSPAPVCHAIGGGKYNCQVWRTASSYTAAGARAGTLNSGTNYFYCQQDLGRRESHGRWTNTWWAKTDDDSGNSGVYVSDVYIQGGDNDSPVPGLPVC
ncbi:serine/threonine-protein kinase [Streptomyces sp. NPDC002701]|uniref:serine/threonine-protein kinase n=1 Tax=Streptomyces sp. NPDC002701 TaxID=3364661 RepID=UPI0036B831C0